MFDFKMSGLCNKGNRGLLKLSILASEDVKYKILWKKILSQ